MTLRARLVLLVFAGVLPLLALNLGRIYADHRQERRQAGRQALDLTRSLSLAVDGMLRTHIAALEVLTLSRPLAEGDLAGFRAQAETVVGRQLLGANILLLDPDGQQLMNTASPPGVPLPRRIALDNQARVLATAQPSVSDIYQGLVVRRPIISIDVPVLRPDGSVGLVLALNPSFDAFDALIRRQQPARGWIITILDRSGRRVARLPAGEGLVRQPAAPEFLRAWAGQDSGILDATSPEGAPVLAAFTRIPDIGWTVSVAVETAALSGAAWREALASLAAGLGLLAVGLLLAHWIGRGILRPIAALGRLATIADTDTDDATLTASTGLPETDAVAAALLAEGRRRRAAIASLRESERRLRLVVGELNHRAKNALATVQALALQTARGDAGADPQRFAEAFNARLRTLARAHDLLTAFSWEAAALDAILEAGLAPWLAAERGTHPQVTVRSQCSRLRASPGQAQALVMALHELATNAAKYGALSVPAGRVEVTCQPGPEADSTVVEWRERGGPPVPGRPTRRGFGTRLLERALAHDLGPGGSVAIDFAPDGVQATIHFLLRQPHPDPVAAAA